MSLFDSTLNKLTQSTPDDPLTAVELSYAGISDAQVQQLCVRLQRTAQPVKQLFLAGNTISDASMQCLADTVAHVPGLAVIDLSDNLVSGAGAKLLLDAVTFTAHVSDVYIGGNSVNERMRESLDAVLRPRRLIAEKQEKIDALMSELVSGSAHALEIDLGGNEMLLARFEEFVRRLRAAARRVEKLNCGYVSLSDAMCVQLADVVRECSALRELQLDGNSVADAGAAAIGGAVAQLGALHAVDLGDNAIGDAGALALMRGMEQCPSLVKLYIGGNGGVSAAVLRRVNGVVRERTENERRVQLEQRKLAATSRLSRESATECKKVFRDCDQDADGVVKLAKLVPMMRALGLAASSEQASALVRLIDRPAAEMGLIDFATFVLVLEQWRERYDPELVLDRVWRDTVGDKPTAGVAVVKQVLSALQKPVPSDTILERIISQISPKDMTLTQRQFNDLLACWDYMVQNARKICKS